MHTDVTDLRDFYQTPLGLVVRRLLAQKIRAKWPRASHGHVTVQRLAATTPGRAEPAPVLDRTCGSVMGFGFASPFLGSFRGEAARICALMPDGQGALVWPSAHRNMTVLVEEAYLPLLIVHGLEVAERPAAVLREMWRVLTPQGRLLIIAPNRSGVWARTDRTPFGQGRPYSRGQLDQLLRAAMFTPVDWDSALHLPPVQHGLVLRSAPTLERLGARVSRRFAGVIVVEATKELVAPIGTGLASRAVRQVVPVRAGVLVPSGARRG
jgi:SAM-dependent methyltransferase